jgi:O-antigen ligase
MAPIVALAGLIAAPWRLTAALARQALWPAATLLAFTAWTIATITWSPLTGWQTPAKLAAMWGFGFAFVLSVAAAPAKARGVIAAAGAFACLGLAAMLAVEALWDMPMNRSAQPNAETGALIRNPGKGASLLLVLAFGLAGALGGAGRIGAGLSLAGVSAAVALAAAFGMDANLLAALAGLAAFGLAQLAPGFALGLTAGGIAGWLMLAPLLAPLIGSLPGLAAQLPLSWQQRLEIWRFAEARIMEKPLTGWGLDGARSFKGQFLQIGDQQFPAIPLHPHSASLHIWLETGAIGATLAAACIIATAAAAARALHGDRIRLGAASAAMAVIAVLWNVSYGAWQEWWMTAPFLAAALILAGRRAG